MSLETRRIMGTKLRSLEDLTGLRLGTMVVVSLLKSASPSPWWLMRCKKCKSEQARRGHAIRQARRAGGVMRCVGCLARKGVPSERHS